MASTDWIKMRVNLWDDPRVTGICDQLEICEALVVGSLYWLWSTADSHSVNGFLPGMTPKSIDRKTGVKGLGDALVNIGWVGVAEAGIHINRFEEHNGASAKKRAETAKRVAKHRAGSLEAPPEDDTPPGLFDGSGDVTQPALPGENEIVTGALARTREELDKSKTPPKDKSTIDLKADNEAKRVEQETIEKIFNYWRKTMKSPRSRLDPKRYKAIKAALKIGYTPRDLCRAINGCALTPHNMGKNANDEKYNSIDLILRDAEHIDRFVQNSKTPPVPAEKKVSNEIPGWWKSDDLALQQATLVGVGGPLASESRDTWHGRIKAAIENGGKPPAPAAAVRVAPLVEAPRVELTPEQKAANRASLFGALKKPAEQAQ